jgi:hypothetical protein
LWAGPLGLAHDVCSNRTDRSNSKRDHVRGLGAGDPMRWVSQPV